jgi:hypothetical protein
MRDSGAGELESSSRCFVARSEGGGLVRAGGRLGIKVFRSRACALILFLLPHKHRSLNTRIRTGSWYSWFCLLFAYLYTKSAIRNAQHDLEGIL